MAKIDFTGVENKFDVVPEGTYPAKLTGVELRDSQTSDAKYYRWEYTLTDPEFSNRRVWQNTSLGASSAWKLAETISALTGSTNPRQIDTDDLIGNVVSVCITHREWQGKTQMNVDSVHALQPRSKSTSRPKIV